MKCLAPRHLVNKATRKSMWVACGKCSHCLENRRESWLFRLDNELKHCRIGIHCTLQYDDDHIEDNVLDKRHVQLLFKKLRNRNLKFSYYGIGEYGTKDRRKHFHIAFFIDSFISQKNFKSLLDSLWDYGFVYYTRLKHRRLAYILHYHVRPKIVDNKPTCQFFSKGLGSLDVDDDEWRRFCVSNNTSMVFNRYGKKIPLPRYYRKKYGIELGENSQRVKTILDVISVVFGKPVFEISPKDISKYMATLFDNDLKKREKYNLQKKGF